MEISLLFTVYQILYKKCTKFNIYVKIRAENLDKIKKKSIYYSKGKPVERQGRKAMGLRSQVDYDSRLPH